MDACDGCLRRSDLLAAAAGWIEIEWLARRGRPQVLSLPDDTLLGLVSDPEIWLRYEQFDAAAARERVAAALLTAVCHCHPGYPSLLRELPDPPAVLHVRGDPAALEAQDAVAIVGARRASEYGLDVARSLGRALSVSGLTVVSGLALGVDSAAHAGALAGPAPVVAVLAGGADVPYPAGKRSLYAAVAARGAVVSELPPGTPVRRWAFPARNRIIAALARATIVVEAAERSGSLITADLAVDIGRAVGAVPGRITAPMSAGTHALLAAGAAIVRGPQDVLDLLADHGFERSLAADDGLPDEPGLRRLMMAIGEGRDTLAGLVRAPEDTQAVLRDLAELERRGFLRREFGGRYVRA